MIRRQLILFDGYSTDYRVGSGALGELARLFKGLVTRPKRAVVVCDGSVRDDLRERVELDLASDEFAVEIHVLPEAEGIATIERASELHRLFARTGLTSDDAVIAVGASEVCALAMFAARTWCGGTAVALIPTTLDAMATTATTMRPLDAGDVREAVSVPAHAALVVCDTDLLTAHSWNERALGLATIAGSILTESRRAWDRFAEIAASAAAGEPDDVLSALAAAQTARAAVLKAANPSSRSALGFGQTTARVLRDLTDGTLGAGECLAEGIRFESRLAHDANDFDLDDVFSIDDVLADLGFEEPVFDIDENAFIEGLRAVRFSASNRFMLPLPRTVGSLRLCTVEDEVLSRHAAAYLESRRSL